MTKRVQKAAVTVAVIMYVKLQQLTVSLCMLALLRFQCSKSFLLQLLQYRVTDRDS